MTTNSFKKYKHSTMLSTTFCWDCAKPLKEGIELSKDCECHNKQLIKKEIR